jgi:hypothetical protein
VRADAEQRGRGRDQAAASRGSPLNVTNAGSSPKLTAYGSGECGGLQPAVARPQPRSHYGHHGGPDRVPTSETRKPAVAVTEAARTVPADTAPVTSGLSRRPTATSDPVR